MQKYQSHKIVEAGQITSIEEVDDGTFAVRTEGDEAPYMVTQKAGRRILGMASNNGVSIEQGHLMVYKDGYVSWAPNHTMEDYDLVQPSSGKSQIADYRQLDDGEIAAINDVQSLGKTVGEFVAIQRKDEQCDPRWVALGATHLQQGLMCLTRAIAKPEFF